MNIQEAIATVEKDVRQMRKRGRKNWFELYRARNIEKILRMCKNNPWVPGIPKSFEIFCEYVSDLNYFENDGYDINTKTVNAYNFIELHVLNNFNGYITEPKQNGVF